MAALQITAVQAAAVALGAAGGALARWLAGLMLNGLWAAFPLGTLLVNCLGGLLIGMAMVWFARWPDETLRLLLVGLWLTALLHSAAHLLGALACTALGFALARGLLR
ncbi:MAG: camphor resistance protein CrcB [Burkholderiales bacterium PBB5]|nr:MAG: camphor resistance protein CrcB [Burkholderiales bacterium PBB5]